MSDLDTQSSNFQSEMGQYLRKYALLYSKCAKGLDSNVSPEEMNKELIRMAGYYSIFHLVHLKVIFEKCFILIFQNWPS